MTNIVIKTDYGDFTARLADYQRNFRPDNSSYYTNIPAIDNDLASMTNCKKLEFCCNVPITINGKVYDRVQATVSWTKYRKGEELPEPILYAWFTNASYTNESALTSAAKAKLEKDLEIILIEAYHDIKDTLIAKWKASYLEGHKENLERILKVANEHLTYIKSREQV